MTKMIHVASRIQLKMVMRVKCTSAKNVQNLNKSEGEQFGRNQFKNSQWFEKSQ